MAEKDGENRSPEKGLPDHQNRIGIALGLLIEAVLEKGEELSGYGTTGRTPTFPAGKAFYTRAKAADFQHGRIVPEPLIEFLTELFVEMKFAGPFLLLG